MDNHHRPLATESFSYSWLITPDEKPNNYPLPKLEHHLHDEIPHQMHISSSSFNFDISNMLSSSHHLSSCSPPSPFHMVDADQLFSNGIILPSSAIMTPSSTNNSTGLSSNKLSSSSYVSFVDQTQTARRSLLSKNKLWVNLMRRLVGCLMSPGRSKRSSCTKVDDFSRTEHDDFSRTEPEVVKTKFSNSDDVSDRSTASSSLTTSTILTVDAAVESSRGDQDENSILEAILYCKKSCGGEY